MRPVEPRDVSKPISVQNIYCIDVGALRGYYRPGILITRIDGQQVKGSSYNIGKQSEFKQRVFFQTQKSMQDK